jgi:hypothetical protein
MTTTIDVEEYFHVLGDKHHSLPVGLPMLAAAWMSGCPRRQPTITWRVITPHPLPRVQQQQHHGIEVYLYGISRCYIGDTNIPLCNSIIRIATNFAGTIKQYSFALSVVKRLTLLVETSAPLLQKNQLRHILYMKHKQCRNPSIVLALRTVFRRDGLHSIISDYPHAFH